MENYLIYISVLSGVIAAIYAILSFHKKKSNIKKDTPSDQNLNVGINHGDINVTNQGNIKVRNR